MLAIIHYDDKEEEEEEARAVRGTLTCSYIYMQMCFLKRVSITRIILR